MSNQLYVIDTQAAALSPLPASPVVSPTFVTYTLRFGGINNNETVIAGQQITNFSQEQAVLYVTGRFELTSGSSDDFNELDLRINGTSFVSQGSPSTFATAAGGGLQFPLWTASDMTDPPIVPAFGTITVAVIKAAQINQNLVLDFCLVPRDQLPLLAAGS